MSAAILKPSSAMKLMVTVSERSTSEWPASEPGPAAGAGTSGGSSSRVSVRVDGAGATSVPSRNTTPGGNASVPPLIKTPTHALAGALAVSLEPRIHTVPAGSVSDVPASSSSDPPGSSRSSRGPWKTLTCAWASNTSKATRAPTGSMNGPIDLEGRIPRAHAGSPVSRISESRRARRIGLPGAGSPDGMFAPDTGGVCGIGPISEANCPDRWLSARASRKSSSARSGTPGAGRSPLACWNSAESSSGVGKEFLVAILQHLQSICCKCFRGFRHAGRTESAAPRF